MTTTRRTVDYRIDPFDLHLFSAVIAHGTITAAAETVNLSLAAASARLKALEDTAGTRLLDRSRAGTVAPAKRYNAAIAKAARRTLDDGTPAHSFSTLMGELATLPHAQRRARCADVRGHDHVQREEKNARSN